MEKDIECENRVIIVGTIEEDIKPDLLYYGVLYYKTFVKVGFRDTVDHIPIIAKKKQFKKCSAKAGSRVYVEGVVETRNEYDQDGKCHTKLYVRAQNLEWLRKGRDRNEIKLRGRIFNQPNYIPSATGRPRTYLTLEVEDFDGSTNSFIPCVAWRQNALNLKNRNSDEELSIEGRFTSRHTFLKDEEESTIHEIRILNVI